MKWALCASEMGKTLKNIGFLIRIQIQIYTFLELKSIVKYQSLLLDVCIWNWEYGQCVLHIMPFWNLSMKLEQCIRCLALKYL